MQDIRNKFSLDWLSGSSNRSSQQTSSQGQSALDEAVVYYSQPMIKLLEAQNGQPMGLHELARSLKDDIKDFDFSNLWEVTKHLANLKIVEIVDASDAAGNYLIKLARR
ncbi:MAG: hypothetical protein JWM21_1268 [Acidobacteria bacterium]|nr:hypothetical protein [Acidobacteriota bacterium]